MGEEMKKFEEEQETKYAQKVHELMEHHAQFEIAAKEKLEAEAELNNKHFKDSIVNREIQRIMDEKLKEYNLDLDKNAINGAKAKIQADVDRVLNETKLKELEAEEMERQAKEMVDKAKKIKEEAEKELKDAGLKEKSAEEKKKEEDDKKKHEEELKKAKEEVEKRLKEEKDKLEADNKKCKEKEEVDKKKAEEEKKKKDEEYKKREEEYKKKSEEEQKKLDAKQKEMDEILKKRLENDVEMKRLEDSRRGLINNTRSMMNKINGQQ